MFSAPQIPFEPAEQSLLIVDDNENTQRIFEIILRSWGIKELRMAGDGGEALEVLQSWVPNLIITDWNMKPMGGQMFLSELRKVENGDLGKMPVLVVTAHSSGPVVHAVLAAGANQIIVKPIVPKVLYSRIVWTLQDSRPFTESGGRYVLPSFQRSSSSNKNQSVEKAYDASFKDSDEESWLVD